MDSLTGFQRDTLYVIVGREAPNGQTVKRVLEEYYSDTVTRGRVYSNLDELADAGLVTKRPKTDRSNQYELTEKGVRVMLTHRQWTERQLLEAFLPESCNPTSIGSDGYP